MPELWYCYLVAYDVEDGELLAEGEMTFNDACAVISKWYPDRDVQILTPDDISPSIDRA